MNGRTLEILGTIFYVFIVCVGSWADTVYFKNNMKMEVQGFQTLSDRIVRLELEDGSLQVPVEWIQKVVLDRVSRSPAPKPDRVLIPYQEEIVRLAEHYNLDWRLLASIIEEESRYNPWAVSQRGAVGLMQVIPATGELFGITDLFDPVQNMRAGTAYFAYLLNRYKGDIKLSLAAYNAGPAIVDKYKAIPPFAETRAYVQSILDRYDAWLRNTHPPLIQ